MTTSHAFPGMPAWKSMWNSAIYNGASTAQWLGGDGVWSIDHPTSGDVLFMFGDTPTIVTGSDYFPHNSGVIWNGSGLTLATDGINGLIPNDGDGTYYWPGEMIWSGTDLFTCANHIQSSGGSYTVLGKTLVKLGWTSGGTPTYVSKTALTSSHSVMWGASFLKVGNTAYIFGTKYDPAWASSFIFGSEVYLASAPVSGIGSQANWQYWVSGTTWSSSESSAGVLIANTVGPPNSFSAHTGADGSYYLTGKRDGDIGNYVDQWNTPFNAGGPIGSYTRRDLNIRNNVAWTTLMQYYLTRSHYASMGFDLISISENRRSTTLADYYAPGATFYRPLWDSEVIRVAQNSADSGTSSVGTLSVTVTGVAPGDLVLCAVSMERSTATPGTPVTPAGNSFTVESGAPVTGATMAATYAHYTLQSADVTGGSATISSTASASATRRQTIGALVYRGWTNFRFTLGSYTENGTGVVTATTPNITPTFDNAHLIGGIALVSNVTPYQRTQSVNSPYTMRVNDGSTNTSNTNAYIGLASQAITGGSGVSQSGATYNDTTTPTPTKFAWIGGTWSVSAADLTYNLNDTVGISDAGASAGLVYTTSGESVGLHDTLSYTLTGGTPVPSYITSGPMVSGTDNITVGIPTSGTAGALAILQVVSGDSSTSMPVLSSPYAWTLIGTGTGGGSYFGASDGPRRLSFWARTLTGTETDPTVYITPTPGSLIAGRIYAIQGDAGSTFRYVATFAQDVTPSYTGATATAVGTAASTNYLVCVDADASDINVNDYCVLTNSSGALKENTVFQVTSKSSAFGYTNIFYSNNSAAGTVTGDVLRVVGTDFSATTAQSTDWQTNDFALVGYALNDQDSLSSESITVSGVGFNTVTEVTDQALNVGNFGHFGTAMTSVVTGSTTARPATLAATMGHAAGGVAGVVRLRALHSVLTATVQGGIVPRILVEAQGLAADGVVAITISRIVNGVATVLRGANSVLTGGADAFIRTDAEQPFGVSIYYQADLVDSLGNSWTIISNTVTTNITNALLSDPIKGLGANVQILSWSEKSYERDSSIYHVNGRTIVVSSPRAGSVSQLVIFTKTNADRDAINELLDNATNNTILLRQQPLSTTACEEVDTDTTAYLAVTQDSIARNSRFRSANRRVTLQCVEVDPWTLSVEAAGSALQDIANYYYPNGTLLSISNDFTGLTLLEIAERDWTV